MKNFRVLPMRNVDICAAYLAGVPMCDLVEHNRASVPRIKSILRAYDIPLRTRSQAINASRTKPLIFTGIY